MLNSQMVDWCTQRGLLLTVARHTSPSSPAEVAADVLLEALIQAAEAATLSNRH